MNSVRADEQPVTFRGVFRTDLVARACYAEGAGIARCIPAAVAVPLDVEDVATLVRWARQTGHVLIPRGSGSGMAAGAVGPHVMLDLSRFDRVWPLDVEARVIRAGAGALRNTVDGLARAKGLRFPVDPSSGAFCTVGGMAATNAAGARSLRHGATRPWVVGLHCVFEDGSVAWIRRGEPVPLHVPAVARLVAALDLVRRGAPTGSLHHAGVRKESSGYHLATDAHLVDTLVGSEGTMAVFTDVELRLDAVPVAVATVLATFGSLEQATLCAIAVAAAGASACEMLDRTYLDVAERTASTGVDASAQAVLLIEVEGDTADGLRGTFDEIVGIVRRSGAIAVQPATDDADIARIWALRHSASPTLARLPASTRSMQFIEDGCVPPERFAEYVRGVRGALARADTVGVIFGHAGDAHAHVNPLVDLTRPDWRDTVRRLFSDVADLTGSLGGTLAGEHGDGRLRAHMSTHTWSTAARAAFANVKAAADPAGVFNAGCKVPAPTDDPLGSIRHDPALAPLPDAARATLDAVERNRAWHRFRLNDV